MSSRKHESRIHNGRLANGRLASIGLLAAGVAHDFNNLLTVILGHTGCHVSRADVPADVRADMQQVMEAAGRAAELTCQLLSYARKQPQMLQPIDLNTSVDAMLRLLRRTLGEAIEIRYEPAEDLPLIAADSGQLDQVLTNLAINARDAMPAGGHLFVCVSLRHLCPDEVEGHGERQPGRHVCLSVRDSGHGIPQDILPHIFDPFFTTKEPGRGTGLGLAAVHGIVKQHRGWTEVGSAPGEGTRFDLYFPALEQHEMSVAPTAPLPRPETLFGSGQTILVVEDEAAVRELARHSLERFGYSVLEAANGPAALELFQRAPAGITALVTDIIMPGGMSGRDLALLIHQVRPDLPVVYTSGYGRDATLPDFRETKTESYVPKPYRVGQLIDALGQVLAAQNGKTGRRGDGEPSGANRSEAEIAEGKQPAGAREGSASSPKGSAGGRWQKRRLRACA